MKNTKNVLIVSSEFPPLPGGIGNHAFNLACALNDLGHEVMVITDQRSKEYYNDEQFDNSLQFKVFRIRIAQPRFLMYFTRLLKVLVNVRKYHVVIASGKFSLWSVAFSSLFFRKKIVAIIHGTEVNFKSRLLRFSINQALKRFKNIVAVSNYTKSLITQIETPIRIVPNGIDELKFNADKVKNIEIKGVPSLITVGRISERKGQFRVIERINKLKVTYPDIHYHCVGLIPFGLDFQSEISRLGLAEHVTLHGVLNDNELKEYLKASDIFMMLSKEDFQGDVEGFGISILESNAMATPAIGSKGCGIEDAINDGVTGRLIDPDSESELLQALVQILNRKERFSKEALRWAKEHSWGKIVKQYEALI